MRIIKEGKIKEKFKKCDSCSTEFAYNNKDIITTRYFNTIEPYEATYIICPVCGQRIIIGVF